MHCPRDACRHNPPMRSRDDESWNVLAIGARGETGKALAILGETGRFRTGGYPQVLIGNVARAGGDAALLDGLGELVRDPERTGGVLDRIVPVEEAVSFVRDDVTETLCEAMESRAPRLCGKTFYVRVHLRGLKGRIEHPAVERALGDFLTEFAGRAGDPPTVRFRDPDVVVVAEVVGRRVGYAFLGREERSTHLIKVK